MVVLADSKVVESEFERGRVIGLRYSSSLASWRLEQVFYDYFNLKEQTL